MYEKTYRASSLVTLLLVLMTSMNAYAVETSAPAEPNWGLDPITGTLMIPGISVMSMGTLSRVQFDNAGVPFIDGDHALKMFDTSNITPTALRPQISPDIHTHHNWDVGSIGNVYGLTIDSERNIYATASTHWGAGFLGVNSILQFGSIGAGATPDTAASDTNPGVLNDLAAAGAIYKIDKITGNVTLFATLPQTNRTFSHLNCENNGVTLARNTGPALGNIAFDPIHKQFFVSNFEDGKIYRLDSTGTILNTFDGFAGTGLPTAVTPYGLAVNPDATKLYFGTHELNTNPRLFAVALDVNGDFTGSAVNQNATLGTDLTYTQQIEGGFFALAGTDPGWVAYSDLSFSPQGELLVGVRTGCDVNFATSHNHGGTAYLLVQDGSGLYNTPAPQVPGNTAADDIGDYDAGSFPSRFNNQYGPDDGYGGIAIYDKGTGKYDYLLTSADITTEAGPHGFLLFPENFTATGAGAAADLLIQPGAAFSAFASSTTTTGDYKGSGGDIEVLSVLVDLG